jgi:hypothetical protein
MGRGTSPYSPRIPSSPLIIERQENLPVSKVSVGAGDIGSKTLSFPVDCPRKDLPETREILISELRTSWGTIVPSRLDSPVSRVPRSYQNGKIGTIKDFKEP